MSYRELAQHGAVVVCDCCGAFGAIGDRDWRHMHGNSAANAIHLCRSCRPLAVWCETHQSYHLPDALHRKPCTICGGLFTARVALGMDYCPSCRHTLGVTVPPKTTRQPQTGGLRNLANHLPWRRNAHHR